MRADRARLYARLPVTDDVAWWRHVAAPGTSVLYLGGGTGRLAVPLAEGGARLTVVERDPDMVDALSDAAADVTGLVVVAADATALALDRRFDRVLLPANLVNEVDDAQGLLTSVARHCHEATAVALQMFDPYWLADPPSHGRGQLTAAGGGVSVELGTVSYDPWTQRSSGTIAYHFEDGETLTDRLDARAIFPGELDLLLDRAGLTVLERWGARPGRDRPERGGGTWHLVLAPGEGRPVPSRPRADGPAVPSPRTASSEAHGRGR